MFNGFVVNIVLWCSNNACSGVLRDKNTYGDGDHFFQRQFLAAAIRQTDILDWLWWVPRIHSLTAWWQLNCPLHMVSTGTVNDIGKIESIFLDPYPIWVGHDFDIHINVSLSKIWVYSTINAIKAWCFYRGTNHCWHREFDIKVVSLTKWWCHSYQRSVWFVWHACWFGANMSYSYWKTRIHLPCWDNT